MGATIARGALVAIGRGRGGDGIIAAVHRRDRHAQLARGVPPVAVASVIALLRLHIVIASRLQALFATRSASADQIAETGRRLRRRWNGNGKQEDCSRIIGFRCHGDVSVMER